MAYSKIILNGETLMDVTSDTVAAGSLLSGKTATKNDGTKVTGNIASKTASDLTASGATVTAAAGYYPSAVSKAVTTTTHPNPTAAIASSTGVVTATHTQTTGYVTSGTTTGTLSLTTQAGKTVTPTESAQTAVASYRWTTGPISVAAISSTYVGTGVTTRSAADMTVAGQSVTAPAGYYSQAFTKAVTTTTHPNPTAAITSSTGVITATHTQETGYVTGGTTTGTLDLTTKAAATINTSTADQTIASYRWLTGTQTIKSVTTTNLTAANIASGVVVKVGDANNASRITQVTGTYAPAVSSVTVTPTETTQTFNATGVYGYKPVTVNGISSTYVGTGIARKSSTDVAFASATATFTAPIGYYSAAATKTLTTQAAQTIYPSTADQTVASYRWLTGNQTFKSVTTTNLTAANIVSGTVVKVGDSANASRITQVTGTYSGIIPTGTLTISSAGTHNVYNYASASVKAGAATTPATTISPGIDAVADTNGVIHITASGSSSITPTVTSGYVTGGTAGTVTVNGGAAVPATTLDSNLVAGNIASGATIFGVAGSYEGANQPYYGIYQAYTKGETIHSQGSTFYNYTSDEVVSFCNSFSGQIEGNFFAGLPLSGQFTFNNISALGMDTFAYTDYPSGGATLIFPNLSFINNRAFSSNYNIKEIQIPQCSRINTYTFYDCRYLTNVYIPSCTSIGAYAFNNCHSLTTISSPNCTYIGSSAFYSCSSLATISFPVCTSIGSSAFHMCSSLTIVDFPSCTSIGAYAFGSCSSLATISFPNCTYIGAYAFNMCPSLTIVDFPNCTYIGGSAFNRCSFLTAISFPVCTSIGAYAFSYCSSLITVDFPNCTSIGACAFISCVELTTVSLPICTSFYSSVFSGCFNLISLYLNNVSSVPTWKNDLFRSTPISTYSTSAGRYGSIFVPSSLYASFTTATGWAAYSARMVSV